jgi:aldehyde:ferredoxin oxidoreductase
LLEGIKDPQESEYFDAAFDPNYKEYIVFGNYEEGEWKSGSQVDHEDIMKKIQIKRVGCFSCPMRCLHLVKVAGTGLCMSFCEPLNNFSRFVWSDDIETTWQSTYLVNQHGLDSVETAGLIAYLMELYERGLIDEKFSDGIPMEKGNKEAILKTIHKIARGEGFGKKLKYGIDPLAKEIGGGAEELKVTSHNMFPHGYYFQAHRGAALLEAVGHSKGDCFPSYGASIETGIVANPGRVKKLASNLAKEKYGDASVFDGSENLEALAKMVIDTEHMARIPDMVGICYYAGNIYSDAEFYKKLSAAFYCATGVQTNEEQLLLAGERLRNLERLIDIREGMSRGGDYLPKRFFKIPIRSGKHQGKVLDENEFERMKDLYYDLRGWDRKTGYPKEEKLNSLGLSMN